MSSSSSSFDLLARPIQQWIWNRGWEGLRSIQEKAIPLVLANENDIIISATTASGKTEAALLPALTKVYQEGGLILYVSPLKALINDQLLRFRDLCADLELPLVPWHGDIAQNKKIRFTKNPKGILLITPESLEALFVNRGYSIERLFESIQYTIVDELHTFVGTERGKQLQALMRRLEDKTKKRVTRIGLSATLGDLSDLGPILRPVGDPPLIIASEASGGLKVQLKAYEGMPTSEEMVTDIFYATKDSNNLIFPNTRANVEALTFHLNQACRGQALSPRYIAHHSSLAKQDREHAELLLKSGHEAVSAVCSSTLELGVDIGEVESTVQVGPPPSVASLRQRLGRSGRRGSPAILRACIALPPLGPSPAIPHVLAFPLVKLIACINLLGKGWCEPASSSGLHLSTLVQQILSVIASDNGATAGELWRKLVADNLFGHLTTEEFKQLLKYLHGKDLLVQDSTGTLLLGQKGERYVNHYEFYNAFSVDEMLKVSHAGHIIGEIAVSHVDVLRKHPFLLGGKQWRAIDINFKDKVVTVEIEEAGDPPMFDSEGSQTHRGIRQEMLRILSSEETVPYMNTTGHQMLGQARAAFRTLGNSPLLVYQGVSRLLLWESDATVLTIALLLQRRGVHVERWDNLLSIDSHSLFELKNLLHEISEGAIPSLASLLPEREDLYIGKWDWALPDSLLQKNYASIKLDFDRAYEVITELSATSLALPHA